VTVVDDRNDWKYDIIVGGSGATAIKGVAYNPNTNHLFVTQNGNPGHVYVYDGTSYAFITGITVGINPDAFIAVDKTRNRVYVTNQGSNSVTVIQDTTTVATTPPPAPPEPDLQAVPPPDEPARNPCPFWTTDIAVGVMPQGIAVDDVNGKAYVANNVSQTVSRVDLGTNTVEATSGPSVVFGPSAIAVNTTNQRLYVANSASGYKSISVLYVSDLGLAAYISLTQSPRYIYPALDIDRLYVLCSDGGYYTYLSEINTLYNTLVREIRIGSGTNIGAYAVALSQDRALAYVTCHDFSAYGGSVVLVVDLSLGKEVAQFFTHYNQPTDILLDSARSRFYVANEGNGTVVAVDDRNLQLGSVTLGGKPRGLALNSAFRRLAVVQQENRVVSFINTNSFTQVCIPVFLTLTVDRWIAFSARYSRYYVSGIGGNTVSVIRDYMGDGYENDDTYSDAKFILNDTPQTHSIDPAADMDWVKFTVNAPVTLTMVTTDTIPGIYTTTLALYGTDGTTVLVTDTERIDYAFTTDGTYYVRVRATDPSVGDPSYTYQLLLTGGPVPYRIYLPLVTRSGD
jgi:DNA-binding beta-propeller fold protein YncE